MNLNFEALGVTRESLTNAILSELGLTKEEAVVALANELGVEIMDARDYKSAPELTPIGSGDICSTNRGEAEALVLDDLDSIRGAINILYGKFCA